MPDQDDRCIVGARTNARTCTTTPSPEVLMPRLAFAAPAAALAAALGLAACADPAVGPTKAADRTSAELAPAAAVLHVADVEHLYAAVNDPANEGAAIVLAPGTYVLSTADGSGAARPNAGRLELQRDMSLYGVTYHRSAVVIDATGLPPSSFRFAFGSSVMRTAPVRVGRGSNTVEWLTVLGPPEAAAGIATELAGTPSTRVRVAHVVATGAARGVDVRNVGAAMAGRVIHAEIVDGDFSRGVEGIRVANFAGADHGNVDVVMSGNRSYMNVLGCILENNVTNFATITVRSTGDRFEDNGLGCQLGGGFVGGTTGAANSNTTILEAHDTEFSNNTRTEFFNNTGPAFMDFGGLLVVGGHALASVNTASDNTVTVRLWGSAVFANQNADFEAFGAWSEAGLAGIAGTNNHVTIELDGVSKHIDVLARASQPPDPLGTNTVTVIR
jgi:hypothetical protein